MRPIDIKKKELDTLDKELRDWEDIRRHGAWQKLVEYLENRYIDLGMKTCDSLRELSDRNGRMSEIRSLFQFTRHEFNQRQALLQNIRMLEKDEDELPDPMGWLTNE